MTDRVQAPEFPAELIWPNLRGPLSLEQLRGRVVVLYFWTFSSQHCLNVLPELRALEAKYHDGMTIIGVHNPKFEHERSSPNILKAVNRLYFRRPVVSDPDYLLWQLYDIKAWPSMAVIDPEGTLVGVFAGEGRQSELDVLIGQLLDEAAAKDLRVYNEIPSIAMAEPRVPLRFPSKIIASDTFLYLADTSHNRILEVSFEGRINRQFGSGTPAFLDGNSADASFNEPRGLAIIKEMLYVADTGNHSIRRIRLMSGEVDTVAGNGERGYLEQEEYAEPTKVALNAPMDIAATNESLYIAMAGQHQIWQMDLSRYRLSLLAGNGFMGNADGTFKVATFAEPNALACSGHMLFCADSESSSVRGLNLNDKIVQTLIGAGLYEFGDIDGPPRVARFQHPSAVCVDTKTQLIWVADTFNGKLKAVSLRGAGAKTLALPYKFHEPSGVAVGGGAIWVASTNAHEVVRIDAKTGQAKHMPIGE